MAGKDWLIGVLLRQGRLRMEAGEILLTGIPALASRPPESEALSCAEEDLGKVALVRGELSGAVLYSAQLVEILPHLTGALIQHLAKKGVVTYEEIRQQVARLSGENDEVAPPEKLCALVIGHKKSSGGAVNESMGLKEFDFNEDLAIRIEGKVEKTQVQRVYRRTLNELPDDINALNPHCVVSLHCNAFNGRASGTEVLYYHKSENGKRIAEILQRRLVEFLELPDRGVKPKTAEDRGGYLLRHTRAPCVIAEPFFIDNDQDLAKAREDLEGLASVYAMAIDEMALAIS